MFDFDFATLIIRGSISSVAIHPSGKLALSCGHDKTVRVWNLMKVSFPPFFTDVKGRSLFINNRKTEVLIACWSPSGDAYILATANTIEVVSTEVVTLLLCR